ncbi:MAG: FAD-binding oxidoreductase [Tardiphaga sp.]|jgi:hypothetical protein|nr:FAD-binding oxidoreductase [Tardiphaga sp.]
MCGAATPSDSERNVVVRMDRMRSIRNVNSLANSITVDAGCILAEVQAAAAAVDRYFPFSLDRVRDRNAVNGMLGEVAGEAVADANVSETARVQKKIIHDCLKGEERGKIES